MFMIFNPHKNEWDQKGTSLGFHPLRRWAWNTRGQAKCHIAQKLDFYVRNPDFFDFVQWYLGASLLEDVPDKMQFVPTSLEGYVRMWLADHESRIKACASPEAISKIQALNVWPEAFA